MEVVSSKLPKGVETIDTLDTHIISKLTVNTNAEVTEMLITLNGLFGNKGASAKLISCAVLSAHEPLLFDMAQTFALRNIRG